VKILFFVHNLGKTRHFDNVLVELARRGHWITLAAARKRKKPLKLTGVLHAEKRIDVVTCPVHRLDEWENYVRPLRQARDYLRFLHPDYRSTGKLSARAAEYAPPGWATFAQSERVRRRWRSMQKALAAAESLVPTDRYFELFIRSEAPDLVLVTPLVDFGSYQTDYVKAAHRLGIPVAFVPFSWDNLTNRGLVRVSPDRAIVWNDRQKQELVRFHGMNEQDVVIAGAPRFDSFFAMKPASDRGCFLESLGLARDSALLLYLCSSNFVAPQEVAFVRAWIDAVRSSSDPKLANAAILVRPHPANLDEWEGIRLEDCANVAVWPHHSTMNADQGLYDSLHHADAVVGLNTSAMIEAAIVGKPVFTVTTPEFAGGQEQTLHFHYLLAANGGVVERAEGLDEHMRQLSRDLREPGGRRDQARRFVQSFVRPHGLDRPVTPIMVDAILDAARIRKRRRLLLPWKAPAQWLLLTALRRRRSAHARQ